jgi:outer membrane protein assembly factor BamB
MRYASLTILVTASLISALLADDWPQWRGINRDAVLHEQGSVKEFPNGVMPRRWSVPIGSGYSGPTVALGRVYVTDLDPDESSTQVERVLCFNAEDGEMIWSHSYPAPYSVGYTAGPRASVTVHDGKAISVGAMGHLKCLDAEDGKVLWEHDLDREYDIEMPNWGITSAPLVYQDLVIQIVGGSDNACVVAFDLATGRERWRALDERAGYSAPILIRQGDRDVVVCWTGDSVSGLDPERGDVYWNIAMKPRNMPIGVATPVVQDEYLFVSSFYDGSMLIRLDLQQPQAKKVWYRRGIDEKNTDALHCMISSPLIKGDYIYGVDSYGELRCLDLKTGDRVWEDLTAVPKARWATIHIMRDGERELMLNDQGQLILATLTPQGYREHCRADLIKPTLVQLRRRDGVTWAHPAVANGYIYVRSDAELVCAPLPLQN